VVNGFVGGDLDPETGWLVVRRSHAHSWVEVHDHGWWLLDPTPGPAASVLPTSAGAMPSLSHQLRRAWDTGVLAYDRDDQLRALVAAARGAEKLLPFTTSTGFPWKGVALLGVLLGATAVVGRLGVVRLTRRWLEPARGEPTGPVARAHHRARVCVSARGYDVPRGLPPVDAARWLQARAPGDASDALLALAWLYYEVHLGRGDVHAAAPAARKLLERVEALESASA
jgi:hypothetical protein